MCALLWISIRWIRAGVVESVVLEGAYDGLQRGLLDVICFVFSKICSWEGLFLYVRG